MGHQYTYTVAMNITLSIDEQIVEGARKRAEAQGKSLNQLICDYLRAFGGDDPERSIQEFKRLSGRGRSRGSFNRDKIHQRP
jgi:ferritin-like protein